IWASHVLQKMTPEDDAKAYLLAFERCAEPKAQWAGIVVPLLGGDTQKAYFDMESEAAADYAQLKAEILSRARVTTTVWAQCFHAWRFQEGKAPRSQMFDLIHLARRWLQLETNNPARIIKILAMDRFLCGLPPIVMKWVGQGNPANAQELIKLAERYLTAEELAKTPFITKVWSNGRPSILKSRTSNTMKGLKITDNSSPVKVKKNYWCYQCDLGHIAIHCPNKLQPMECGWGYNCGIINMVNNVEGTYQFMMPTKINGRETMALTDTGSAVTLISGTLMKPLQTGITCIHGDVNYYSTTRVQLTGVVPKLPHPVIGGRS
uniref:SCAN box domain-containing protein n=1 Tax=Latimeria chalumnae TaxID=7897 RepID=H2ZT35_LATCH